MSIVVAVTFFFQMVKASGTPPLPLGVVDDSAEISYKTLNYQVACCPENCCCSFCYCGCESCEQKPCCEWDLAKRRFACCLYVVKEQSGRNNEKRGCAVSCRNAHLSCVNCGTDCRNSIGSSYDECRKCGNKSANASCDFCGCWIRRIEINIPVNEPMN